MRLERSLFRKDGKMKDKLAEMQARLTSNPGRSKQRQRSWKKSEPLGEATFETLGKNLGTPSPHPIELKGVHDVDDFLPPLSAVRVSQS